LSNVWLELGTKCKNIEKYSTNTRNWEIFKNNFLDFMALIALSTAYFVMMSKE
jgi:hypothetical protein